MAQSVESATAHICRLNRVDENGMLSHSDVEADIDPAEIFEIYPGSLNFCAHGVKLISAPPGSEILELHSNYSVEPWHIVGFAAADAELPAEKRRIEIIRFDNKAHVFYLQERRMEGKEGPQMIYGELVFKPSSPDETAADILEQHSRRRTVVKTSHLP